MTTDQESPKTFKVLARDRAPLIAFMVEALRADGCRIIHQSPPNRAPFRITFETPNGERMGIIAYAFFANSKVTKKRPRDEHRFQVKYGGNSCNLHDVWQDPFGLYTTLFLGINTDLGFFVGADPVLHSPTKFFISVEFKQKHAEEILKSGWHVWERDTRNPDENDDGQVEVLVGGKARSFLRYIRFERDALREDQGHRQLLAEQLVLTVPDQPIDLVGPTATPSPARLHQLAHELEMNESEVLDLIAGARRLKMAVRGWVAEEHLVRSLCKVRGVTECVRLDEEGGPDIRLRYDGSEPITVECKNVLREKSAKGLARMDFQRTRASKKDPCSRYYSAEDFDVVAACLHAVTASWEFRFAPATELDRLVKKCPGKLSNLVQIDARWIRPVEEVLRAVVDG